MTKNIVEFTAPLYIPHELLGPVDSYHRIHHLADLALLPHWMHKESGSEWAAFRGYDSAVIETHLQQDTEFVLSLIQDCDAGQFSTGEARHIFDTYGHANESQIRAMIRANIRYASATASLSPASVIKAGVWPDERCRSCVHGSHCTALTLGKFRPVDDGDTDTTVSGEYEGLSRLMQALQRAHYEGKDVVWWIGLEKVLLFDNAGNATEEDAPYILMTKATLDAITI